MVWPCFSNLPLTKDGPVEWNSAAVSLATAMVKFTKFPRRSKAGLDSNCIQQRGFKAEGTCFCDKHKFVRTASSTHGDQNRQTTVRFGGSAQPASTDKRAPAHGGAQLLFYEAALRSEHNRMCQFKVKILFNGGCWDASDGPTEYVCCRRQPARQIKASLFSTIWCHPSVTVLGMYSCRFIIWNGFQAHWNKGFFCLPRI